MKLNFNTIVFAAVIALYGWMLFGPSANPPPSPRPNIVTPTDSAVAVRESEAIYTKGMAAVYLDIAGRIEAGEIKSIDGFAEAVYSRNQTLRRQERDRLEKLMAERLGDNDLDPDSAVVFLRELSTAYSKGQ